MDIKPVRGGYVTQGTGAGEIDIRLPDFDITKDHWPKVDATIKRMSDVQTCVVTPDGTLQVKLNIKQLNGEKLANFVRVRYQTICDIIAHKRDVLNGNYKKAKATATT